jgi:CheY-like chemotaxis protein
MSLARRVLVVEDEAALRDVLAEYLRTEGFDVDLAVNGVEALRTARQSTPDVLILDVNMPVLDGVAVLERGRQMPT